MLHNSKQNINLAQLNFGPTTGEYYTKSHAEHFEKYPNLPLYAFINIKIPICLFSITCLIRLTLCYGLRRPYILGNGILSLTCFNLQTQVTILSNPNPKPE